MMHIGDMIEATYATVQERYASKGSSLGISTGFPDLDGLTDGLHRSDLIVLAGRPSMGVTTFCLNLSLNVAVDQGLPVVIFSLGASKETTARHMLCMLAEIDVCKLRNRHMTDEDWGRLESAMERLKNAPIFIEDEVFITAADIVESCNRISNSAKPQVVIVDPVELMENDPDDGDISSNLYDLKSVATELDVVMIAACRLPRSVEERKNKRPSLGDLKQAKAADAIMFLYRDSYYNPDIKFSGKTEIIIERQRHGPTGTLDFVYESSVGRFLQF